MPNWGWKLGSVDAMATSSAGVVATTQSAPTPINGGQTGPVNSPATHTQAPQTVAGGTQQPAATAGTGPSVAVYGQSPAPGMHWQGGASNPNGTQAPNGRQTGGRYVDPHYQVDANGNPLSAQQQTDWRQYDVDRANAATREQAGYAAYKANQAANASPTANGLDYNSETKQWQYYDPKSKQWTPGGSIDDIYNTIFDDKQRAAHPLFYYQNQAGDADYADLRHDQYMNQYQEDKALQGTPTTRYQPVRF